MIDRVLLDMNIAIERETGIRNAIHTVIMEHKTFDRVVMELYRHKEKNGMMISFRPSDCNDFVIAGVRVLARGKK